MSHTINRVLAALNAHDLDSFVSCYRVDATIEDGEDCILAQGHDGIRERYGVMFQIFPELHVEPLGQWTVGSYVVQEERVTGRATAPERHVAVYQLVNDLIVRERLLR